MAIADRCFAAKLTDVEVEATLVRFEELYRIWSSRKTAGRPCNCCTHPQRIEINRMLLAGKPYGTIAKFAGLPIRTMVDSHWQHHLSYAVKMPESALGEMMSVAVERMSRIPFPTYGDRGKQLRWCIRMYHVMREVELDKLKGRSNPFYDIDTKGYMMAINRIRETIILVHDNKKQPRRGSVDGLDEDSTVEDWISDETVTTLEAQAVKTRARKGMEVSSNGKGTNDDRERNKGGESYPPLAANDSSHSGAQRAGGHQ